MSKNKGVYVMLLDDLQLGLALGRRAYVAAVGVRIRQVTVQFAIDRALRVAERGQEDPLRRLRLHHEHIHFLGSGLATEDRPTPCK